MTLAPADLAEFQEDRFPPVEKHAASYAAKVAAGYHRMRESSVAIVGLARNLAAALPATIARVEQLGSLFGDYRVAIFENDSIDETPQLLHTWAEANPRVTALCEQLKLQVNPKRRCLQRAARMASYRNRCRQHVATNWSYTSHTLVADLDLSGGWSYDGVANTFGHDAWDFVGSNGILYRDYEGIVNMPVQYDVWAFRWQGSYRAVGAKTINPLHWDRGEPMLAVYSCFGGLGVYCTEAMLRCAYDGTDCEHVPFHRKMRNNGMGRIFMNPSQIVVY